ncbi:MAG: polyprenyl synthetase family protein [Bdellovibrionaceae bacterium]|nr:polyprenyl synthetase family protein [Pseudobdellovibrionaceae bacterium]
MLEAYTAELSKIEVFIESHFRERKSEFYGKNKEFQKIDSLFESMQYSVKSGGKRFRPLLSILTSKVLDKDVADVIPFAVAVEFIHTYSLIHDDLPCMDDDDLRRGQPSNHKKFGEDIALLAGDALLTEAFYLLSKHYGGARAGQLALLLSEAIGATGMIGGQILDILKVEGQKSKELLDAIHELKTGALIRVSVEGAAACCGSNVETQNKLRQFAASLGFAFQLADDVDDYMEKGAENTNYVNILGLDSTRELLESVTHKSLGFLDELKLSSQPLKDMAEFNFQRIDHNSIG